MTERRADRHAQSRDTGERERRTDEDRDGSLRVRRQSHRRELRLIAHLGEKDHAERAQQNFPIHPVRLLDEKSLCLRFAAQALLFCSVCQRQKHTAFFFSSRRRHTRSWKASPRCWPTGPQWWSRRKASYPPLHGEGGGAE